MVTSRTLASEKERFDSGSFNQYITQIVNFFSQFRNVQSTLVQVKFLLVLAIQRTTILHLIVAGGLELLLIKVSTIVYAKVIICVGKTVLQMA